MAFPVRDLQIATDRSALQQPDLRHEGSAPAVAEAADLDRLQSCLDWLNRERALLALEAADRKQSRRLPRAPQLGPISDISSLTPASDSPLTRAPDGQREKLPFVLAPPLACDRLQPRRPDRPRFSGTMLLVLAAAVLAGSIAYHVSAGAFSLPDIAEAAGLQASSP
jgi:hypothetical protein